MSAVPSAVMNLIVRNQIMSAFGYKPDRNGGTNYKEDIRGVCKVSGWVTIKLQTEFLPQYI